MPSIAPLPGLAVYAIICEALRVEPPLSHLW